MYDYIKGLFVDKKNTAKGTYVTIEAYGIGYSVEIAARDYNSINLDSEGKIYTVLIHKEDKMALCGFLRHQDRDIFNILTSVSGVGVKMALTLINEFEYSNLISFVVNSDYKALTMAKGVGAKLAQKIILELKDKLMNYSSDEPIEIDIAVSQNSNAVEEAQTVLKSLGYDTNEIKSSLSKAIKIKANATAEEILKESLKILSAV